MIGYAWSARITIEGSTDAFFPSGSTLRAQFRDNEYAASALATITTGSGITRQGDYVVDLSLTAAQTAGFRPGSCVMDLIRTDTATPMHYGFKLRIKVEPSVTVPA